MPINKLEQLRKYIFNIEIERVTSFQSQKVNFLKLIKLFRYKVYRVGINHLYDSLIERNHKKRYVAAILKGLRITEVMSKPNDLKQRKDKGSQNKETPFQLSQ
ncbi:unnamed protein product [Camellia sinensis]